MWRKALLERRKALWVRGAEKIKKKKNRRAAVIEPATKALHKNESHRWYNRGQIRNQDQGSRNCFCFLRLYRISCTASLCDAVAIVIASVYFFKFSPQLWWRIWLRCYHGYHPRLSFWLGASDALGSSTAVRLFLSKLSLPLAHSAAFLSSLSLPLSFSSSYFLLFPSQKSSSNAILQRTHIAIEVFFIQKTPWVTQEYEVFRCFQTFQCIRILL